MGGSGDPGLETNNQFLYKFVRLHSGGKGEKSACSTFPSGTEYKYKQPSSLPQNFALQLTTSRVKQCVQYSTIFHPLQRDISGILHSSPLTLKPGQGITPHVNKSVCCNAVHCFTVGLEIYTLIQVIFHRQSGIANNSLMTQNIYILKYCKYLHACFIFYFHIHTINVLKVLLTLEVLNFHCTKLHYIILHYNMVNCVDLPQGKLLEEIGNP